MLWMFYSLYMRGWVVDQYRKFPPSKVSNLLSSTWFLGGFLRQNPHTYIAECLIKFSSLQWWMKIFYYACSWSIAGTQVKCSQASDIKPESSKELTQFFRRNHCARCQCILRFPSSSCSKILPKVDPWRRTPKSDFTARWWAVQLHVPWFRCKQENCLVSARRSD
jgi:hypothetical protein